MAILRKHKRAQYTVIDNTIFRDTALSNKALGLLCRMLALPDGWEFSVMGLVALSNDGKSAIMSQLDELEQHGYLARKQLRNEGKIAGVEYIVSETKMTEKPYAENQHTENQHTENPTQSITNISITNKSSNKDIYTEFENLWAIYPKKQGKEKAYGYYKKARKSGTTYDEVFNGINAYNHFIQVNETDMQFVKMGSTFFSQKAWQDEYPVLQKKSANPFMDMLKEGMFDD